MSKFSWLLLPALALSSACGHPANAGNACRDELGALPSSNSVSVDMELLVPDIASEPGAGYGWDYIQPVETNCPAPTAFPDYMPPPVGSDGPRAPVAKAVQKFNLPSLTGVVFIYHSRGAEEVMTGLAAALVEYRDDGTPGRVYKASELLRDEGWARLTSSTLTSTSVERCDQQIEYFTYSPQGDVTGELHVPERTPRFCEQLILFSP